MRVLRVVGGLDAEFGGPPVVTANSVIAVGQANVHTTVVFPHRNVERALEEPAARAMADAGIALRCFALNRRFEEFNRTRGVSTTLARWLWRHVGEYDLVHVESPWGLHCLAAVAAAKRHRRPIVLMPHECFTRFDLSHAHNPVLRGLKHLLLPLYRWAFDTVIFSSSLEQRDSPGAWPAPRAVVIHHPVPAVRPGPTGPGSARPEGDFRMGFLGRLHPKKNIELLIAALTLLPRQVTLRIAGDGDGDYRRQLEAMVDAAGVGERVTWCGFLTGGAKETFLAEIDLLAMPSRYECFGMVAAEAMAAGTPVLVSPETGVAATVAETRAGVVVAPTGAAVAAAVRELAATPSAHAELSARCVNGARRAFSMETHGAAIASVYGRLRDAGVEEKVACLTT